MTLAEKAEHYELQIDRYIKRTPYGYTSVVGLKTPGDYSEIIYHDSDNDGLWTAMYGASQCFAVAVTGSEKHRAAAKQAFEAIRFLQTVTQGGSHSPPRGYIARSILSTDGRNPNNGGLESDGKMKLRDRGWKIYEPRWPTSADGKWYWKTDTSSDELDGHYFFLPLYYDLVANTESEKERVREVVRHLTDHLIDHNYQLVDIDGQPTRWGVFNPENLNQKPQWWEGRGLNSLSILAYLVVAEHVTGDKKYAEAIEYLRKLHRYEANAMVAKVQFGAGSGNQSDDEMAIMNFYSLLKYAKDDQLRSTMRSVKRVASSQLVETTFYTRAKRSSSIEQRLRTRPFIPMKVAYGSSTVAVFGCSCCMRFPSAAIDMHSGSIASQSNRFTLRRTKNLHIDSVLTLSLSRENI